MDPIKTFWAEPTGMIRRFLRCYSSESKMQLGVPSVKTEKTDPCSAYCNAMRFLDEIQEEFRDSEDGSRRYRLNYDASAFPWDGFPTTCEKCGREMPSPTRQVFTDPIFEVKTGDRAGQRFTQRELPVGALWHISHYADILEWCGVDGLAVMCKTPDGEWHVDGRANNCTKPEDTKHRCWVRHGDPRTGYCHVDKDGTPECPTCDAGAGSIWMSAPNGWHGFLHRGYLVDADEKWKVDNVMDAGKHRLPVAQRVLKPHQIDQPRARPKAPVRTTTVRTAWASNRGFAQKKK